jgi:hypothetical protein
VSSASPFAISACWSAGDAPTTPTSSDRRASSRTTAVITTMATTAAISTSVEMM